MTGTRKVAVGIVIAAVIAAGVWFLPRPQAIPDVPASDPPMGERVMPRGCDPLPVTSPLPQALVVDGPTVEAVVQALDASLDQTHKAFFRCFPDEDDLLARVHMGFGRWLRQVLRLYSTTPLTTSLTAMGITHPDAMSAVIIRAYARALHGVPLDLPDAVARTIAIETGPN